MCRRAMTPTVLASSVTDECQRQRLALHVCGAHAATSTQAGTTAAARRVLPHASAPIVARRAFGDDRRRWCLAYRHWECLGARQLLAVTRDATLGYPVLCMHRVVMPDHSALASSCSRAQSPRGRRGRAICWSLRKFKAPHVQTTRGAMTSQSLVTTSTSRVWQRRFLRSRDLVTASSEFDAPTCPSSASRDATRRVWLSTDCGEPVDGCPWSSRLLDGCAPRHRPTVVVLTVATAARSTSPPPTPALSAAARASRCSGRARRAR